MKGTDKQIRFAEELINTMNEHFDMLLHDCPDPQKDMWHEVKNGYNRIFSESYAGDVINLLIDNKKESYQEYYSGMYHTVMVSSNAMCSRIKKEIYKK